MRYILRFLFLCLVSAPPQWAVAQADSSQIAAHPALPQLRAGQAPGQQVTYPSQRHILKGILYLPPGDATVPAIIWLHAAKKDPEAEPELAAFYLSHGYAFFQPMLSGHNGNPGKTVDERMAPAKAEDIGNPTQDARFVSLLEDAAGDTDSALRWLESNPRIDKSRIFLSGISYGGLECLIDANTLNGVRGYIVFSGGARMFSNAPLANRLKRAVEHSKAPILLIQAANDYSTTPSHVLGPMLKARHDGSKSLLFPAFGDPKSVPMGHVAFATWDIGTKIWGPNALEFLQRAAENGNGR